MDGNNKNCVILLEDKYDFIKKVENLIYLQRWNQDNKIVLASMNSDGTDFKILAEIPPQDENYPYKEQITSLAVCKDWIILNAGSYQGSANDVYYGSLVRLKKDGSELERLPFTGEGEVVALDNWIYFNNYRFHPDSKKKEMLGEQKGWPVHFSENGYLYYLYCPEETEKPVINHFYQYNIEQNHTIILFDGNNALFFEDSTYIDYKNKEIVGDYIYFAVEVLGYAEGETWRGHICSYRYYRIKQDGSALQLIYEDEKRKCPNR